MTDHPPATEQTRTLIDRLRARVVAAVLTPMDATGQIGYDGVERYLTSLTAAEVGGFAVWAHTGRGPYLDDTERARLLDAVRRCSDLPIVAGIGTRPDRPAGPAVLSDSYRRMAAQAAAGGADALMIFPAQIAADGADRERMLYDLHELVAAETGLPQILFVLHGEAGGYPLSTQLLRALLARPVTVGVKIATLDSAMGCQDVTTLVREEFPDRLAITGEDRMFGPSLMWGADCALVGIAAALPELSVSLVDAWVRQDLSEFVRASERLDELARVTFRAPMEGYVQRMHWVAAATGLIAPEFAHDPYGPGLSATERAEILAAVRQLVP